jgi:hypothetical protein
VLRGTEGVNMRGCCAGPESAQRRFARRLTEAAGWVLPGVIVTLLPKCPACLAAWLVLSTGIGLSAPAAGRLRLLLLIVSLVPTLYLTAKVVVRVQRSRADARHRA